MTINLNVTNASSGTTSLAGPSHGSLAGGSYLAVFTRRKDHASAGLIYTAQFSADLSLWTPGGTTPTRRTSDTAPGDYEAVSVPFPNSVPVTGGGAEKVPRFFRVSTTGG